MNRLAVLCLTLPGFFAIARLYVAMSHPSMTQTLVRHLFSIK